MIKSPGKLSEFIISLFEKLKARFIEIISARDHSVHVVLLVLDRTEQNWIFQIHHFRHTAAFWPEELTLGRCWTINCLVRSAEELTQQVRFRREVSAFGMRREQTV